MKEQINHYDYYYNYYYYYYKNHDYQLKKEGVLV